ncbi:hypothetical protein COU18_02845 [Candidatus Kaiserbacteria bacterium CG10_big_fil_rev_8_21_14_0_10_51_14]|uniref:Major facilitator superfamily (MFS) profile domain-containing protein n=1 Tax=Candidatus Kaiserbacteria bacterium CG10_big_fil_rev_8_21_14_0_10_51_14 TaxID=1974610 RepID=A0A2H0UCU5_9BACT|nr:MAG: hypothetical protein COU18_02845 [Candidatus Kaiserbacteria bacterium CG10_big_fil_rev_8_21_14_0_10_51_14]
MGTRFAQGPETGGLFASAQALTMHRFLLRFALAGVNIFAWIFVFQFFYFLEPDLTYAFVRTTLLYALSQMITCLATPLTARLLRGGARRVLLWGTLFVGAAFVALGTAFEGFWNIVYIGTPIAAFALSMGLYRALYWIPYEVEVSAEGRKKSSIFGEIMIALAPLLGGLFIVGAERGPAWILYIGAGIVLLSIVPIFYMRDMHEKFMWKYRETFVHLFRIENRTLVLGSFLEGLSGAALLFFWPLVVFLIVDSSYGMLGVILSLTFLIAILMRGTVRRFMRRLGLVKSRALNVVFAVTPWLFRIAVGGPLAIILVDSYFYTTTPRRLGVDPFAFEQAADAGSYVDEYTALKEIALALGRIVISFAGVAALLLMSIPAALASIFLIAGLTAAVGVLWLRTQ